MFAVFFDAHRRGVERFVGWRLGPVMAEVDDVCAEVFLVALRRFDEVGKLPVSVARGWLLRVADYRCAHAHRSRFRRENAYRRIAHDPDVEGFDPFDDVYLEQLSDDGQIAQRTREVLATLSETHREVLQLELGGPLTGREIAEALGTSDVAGRLRRMRARRAFGAEYTRRFGWPGAALDESGRS